MEDTTICHTTTSEANIMTLLLTVCEQQGLFSAKDGAPDVDEDLIEGRGVDSMGLTYLQAIIEQEFSVEIPLPMLVSELRSHSIDCGISCRAPCCFPMTPAYVCGRAAIPIIYDVPLIVGVALLM